MFTGIVRHVGEVRAVRAAGGGARLTIDLGPLAEGLADGDSVAVRGACLTAASRQGRQADFDVVAETLRRTTLKSLRAGSKVNLERSLSVGGSLDGHLVQGHVDGVARVREIATGGEWLVRLEAEESLIGQMVPKGSVALDGVSLTLAEVGPGSFGVALIPTTLAETTLARLAVGDEVNVETDVIGKYVLRYLQRLAGGGGPLAGGGLTLDKLREAGFA